MSLRLTDFRDLDLMMALAEAADGSEISTQEFSEALGMSSDLQAVAVRMSWMRRFGVVDFDEKTRLWSLTDGADRVIAARRRASAASPLDKVPDEALIEVMAHVTARYRHGDALNATLLRREFQFGTTPGSAAYKRRRR